MFSVRSWRNGGAFHATTIKPSAYLYVTKNTQNIPIATEIATFIRTKILGEPGLTAFAGISCKFLPKLASDHRTPQGQLVITPGMGVAFSREPSRGNVSRDRVGPPA